MSNILKGLTNKLSWLVKSSQNSSQDATRNFSQQWDDVLSLTQKPENLQIFINRILQKKEISEREIHYVIDFLQNIPEIQGSRQKFSGPQIAVFFQNLLKNPTMEQAGYITRTANLRDIAERFVADGPISYLPEEGLPIIHYQMMNKEILTENDIDYVIDYIRDIIGTIKSDSREYSREYMAARFEDLKKNPTEETAGYITHTFGLREIAEKFVESQNLQVENGKNFSERDVEKISNNAQQSSHDNLGNSLKNNAEKFPEKTLRNIEFSEVEEVFLNASESAKVFFEKKFIPKFAFKIQGYEFFLTERDRDLKRHTIAYVKVGNKYEPRVFYFSESGGAWKSMLWMDSYPYNRYNKGEFLGLSYETGTDVSEDLIGILEKIPVNPSLSFKESAVTWEDFSSADITKKYKEEFVVRGKLYEFENNMGSLETYVWQEESELLKNIWNIQISPTFLTNGKIQLTNIQKMKTFQHEYLGLSESYIVTLKDFGNGKKVELVFSHSLEDKPEYFWIENIVATPNTINSFGIPAVSFLGGVLTAKPLDYWHENLREQFSIQELIELPKYGHGGYYADIRPFLQENPLIKEFKKHI